MSKIPGSTSSKGDGVIGGGAAAAIVAAIIVGLIYFGRDVLIPIALLDTSSPAHKRYAIRRLRRRLSSVKVLLGCWLFDGDATQLGVQFKAELVAATLSYAVRHCLEAIKGRDPCLTVAGSAFENSTAPGT